MKNSVLIFVLFAIYSCSTPGVSRVWTDGTHEVNRKQEHRLIYFVQSNNQINSRIAQDELVRLSNNPSIQGYLYTQGERINEGNREYYRQKMLKDYYDYVVVMRLTDSIFVSNTVNGESNVSNRSFYSDYSFQIDPYAYNPGYERPNRIFQVETNVYYIPSGNLVWSSLSKVYNPTSVEQAVRDTSKKVMKKMKRQGFLR
jgi:hypothetical protein